MDVGWVDLWVGLGCIGLVRIGSISCSGLVRRAHCTDRVHVSLPHHVS